MKAYVLHDINDLRYEEVDVPKVKPEEVLVRVKAAGICGSDIPRVYWAGTYSYPLIPGHEFSGVVEEIGAEVDSSWKGKRVGVFPLIPCMECEPCRNQHYELCRKYSYLGSRTAGAFAEYVAVPEWNLIELPDNVSYESATMLEPMAVAVHAIQSMKPEKDDKVVVYGLGTIGILLVMFLVEAGTEQLLVVGNKDFQKKMALQLGIPEENYCDSRNQNVDEWISLHTNGLGADVSFECVGKNETISTVINSAAPNGRVQMIGNPASDIGFSKNIYWKILRNQLTVKGSWNSTFIHCDEDDWHYVLKRLKERRIQPEQFITHKFSAGELEQGFHIMRDKSEEYVKIMGLWE